MSTNKPLISIIVPVYNVKKYLDRCVKSLLDQTQENIQIILVDDGSTDKSSEICDNYAQQFSNIEVIHKKNAGLGQARNTGLQFAKGDYIGFVDSDDYVSKHMYKTLLNLAITSKADCVYCTSIRFWDDNDSLEISKPQNEIVEYLDEEILNSYLLDRIGCRPNEKYDCLYGASVCTGIFKTSIIREQKITFVSERELISEDIIFDIEFIPHCRKIIHTNIPMYFYRFNPKSLTTNYKKDRFEKNIILWEEMKSRLNLIYCKEVIENRLNRYFLTFTRIALIEEVAHMKKNKWNITRKNIYRIVNNKKLEKILLSYPINLLPINQKIFFFSLKKKILIFIVILIKINMIIKKISRER